MHTASTQTVEQISEAYFSAWEARDPDAIVALHTEDTMFWSHVGTDAVRGRAAVRETFAGLFERFPNFGFEVHRTVYGDAHWVLDWTMLWDGPEGERMRLDCIDLVVLADDGLVARKDTFVDAGQLQALVAAR